MDKSSFIEYIVRNFYKRATNDVLIGYQFKKIIDFDSHIPKIVSFWKFQLANELPSKELQVSLEFPKEGFNLVKVHRTLFIKKGEVGRWAKLFNQILNEEKEKYDRMPNINMKKISRDEIFVLIASWSKKIALFEKKFLETPLLFRGTDSTEN